jgi:hypothetical protein
VDQRFDYALLPLVLPQVLACEQCSTGINC